MLGHTGFDNVRNQGIVIFSQIRLDNRWVDTHLRWFTLGNLLTKIQRHRLITQRSHEVGVMLDDQDSYLFGKRGPQNARQLFPFRGVQASGRLVE